MLLTSANLGGQGQKEKIIAEVGHSSWNVATFSLHFFLHSYHDRTLLV